MANTEFRFKEFLIRQDRSAMKVCTDACLFGAWMAARARAASRILDIGSGTGLLMLMLAQKSNAEIEGIEIDPGAFEQSFENIKQSPWSHRNRVYRADAKKFVLPNRYDLIISNPPFYEASLKAATAAKNLARHSDELKLEELIQIIDRHLETEGRFGLLLPYARAAHCEKLAESYGFSLAERMDVKQTSKHSFFRAMLYFSRNRVAGVLQSSMTIRDKDYSREFVDLLRDYYLYL